MQRRDPLLQIYEILNGHFGNLRWWPADSPFEVAVGAILTQNTAWRGVERAISNLKSQNLLDSKKLLTLKDDILAGLIRPSGYYRVKTGRLKSFLTFLNDEFNGSLDSLFREDLWSLRKRLLNINGIGEETADSILLYAGEKPVFVVDAYTRRILERHLVISGRPSYGEIQKLFMERLPQDAPLFNQYHALLVNTGKQFCLKRNPLCSRCPLSAIRKDLSIPAR